MSQGNSVSRNPLAQLAARLDSMQQNHRAASFAYAVIKKYSDDSAGHQAALVTYYGFLSLFPLLLVVTSIIDLVAQYNAGLRTRLVSSVNSYFPIVGHQIQSNIHDTRTGIALVIGLLFALYGARGVSDVIRSALDHAWCTPRAARTGFPKSILQSLAILLGAGFGLLFTTTLTSYALSAFGHTLIVRFIAMLINILLLYAILMFVFLVGTSRRRPRRDIRLGAIASAIGLFILQVIGGYLITHQLHNLRGLYGQFALVLAILFWIYLQAQVVLYAIEINVVRVYKLWPRSITQNPIIAADKRAYRMYAERASFRPTVEEAIDVRFQ